jgi:DNA-directed RNA polymerase specialized sigma24 family protein
MTRVVLESHLARLLIEERRRLVKRLLAYARRRIARLGTGRRFSETEEDVVNETITRIMADQGAYAFGEVDIVVYYYLCRCIDETIKQLHRDYGRQKRAVNALTNVEPQLDENAASDGFNESVIHFFIDQLGRVEEFRAFIERQQLAGVQGLYARRLLHYAARGWSCAQIAADLGVSEGSVRTYRSRMRELIEDFVLMLERRDECIDLPSLDKLPSAPARPSAKTKKE